MNILNDHYLNYLSKNVVSVLLAGALTGFGPGGGGGSVLDRHFLEIPGAKLIPAFCIIYFFLTFVGLGMPTSPLPGNTPIA